MTARPWMPFYFGDYLADTGHLTTLEHGAYLLLIAHYWQKSGLPNDDAQLARISRLTAAQWQRVRPVLKSFFQDDWKHKRIEFELTEAARISEAGRKGGKASAKSREERKSLENNEPDSTTVERPFNDSTNDTSTNGQALQPQSQSQEDKKDAELRSGADRAENVSRETKPKRAKARIPLSDDWKPSEADISYARERGFIDSQTEPIARNFVNYHKAKGSLMADWSAAWRTWVENEIKFNAGKSNGHRGPRPLHDDSRSAGQAAGRLAEQARAGQFSFGPRPGLVSGPGENPVRLLSKG